MYKKIAVMFLALFILAAAFSCKKGEAVKGLELEVAFSEETLSDNLVTDMKYTWRTSSAFVKMEQDFNIFVDFWNKKSLLFEDGHAPQVPTSQWEPNNEYVYSRRIYIPTFIDEFDPNFKGEETLRMVAGFSLPHDTTGESLMEVLEAKIKVFPPPLDTPEVIYDEGWYDLEKNPEAYLKQWRWTSGHAVCIIDNPHREAILIIKGGVNSEALPDQKITFKINDIILDEFIPEDSAFERTYKIDSEMLGDNEEFYLTIDLDKTFVPARLISGSSDERELGAQISFIYFR